jgi:hypothetical protein
MNIKPIKLLSDQAIKELITCLLEVTPGRTYEDGLRIRLQRYFAGTFYWPNTESILDRSTVLDRRHGDRRKDNA